jgi:tetratricopeptide (TPR) repeat protein
MNTSPPAESGLFAGRYRLVRELGRGGMGSVHEAVEVALDRTVALKRLQLPETDSLEARQRFRREVLAAARLTHPGVAQVLGYGTTDDGEHWIAMELVTGDTLRHVIHGARSTRAVLRLFDQILAVLSYVHARGVVHRDLKPENIIVTRVGNAAVCKLLDFGAAAMRAQPDENTLIIGTPRYMAPEQVRGQAGPSVDLYAVGVMLYEALVGEPPVPGKGDDVMAQKTVVEAPPLTDTRFLSKASAELSAVVALLLERDPARRPTSAADVRAALAACPEAPEAHVTLAPPPRISDRPETVRVGHAVKILPTTESLPFIGGEAERGQLADALVNVQTSNKARLFLVEGPAGIGKTHLLDWFEQRIREEGGRTVLRAAHLERGGTHADALRAAVETHLGTWGRGRDVVERVVTAFLERHGEHDPVEIADVTRLLRPGSGEPLSPNHALAVIERVFRRIASVRPLVLCIDDMQLGGAAAFDALSYLLAVWRQAPAPVLVAAAVRTPLDDPKVRAKLRQLVAYEGSQVARVPIEPLSRDDAFTLVGAALGPMAHRGAARIVERAAGNPFFCIQLARIAATAERDDALPVDVRESVEARIDDTLSRAGSSEAARDVLEWIAVLFPPAPTALLERALLGQGRPLHEVHHALDQLVASGLVREIQRDAVEMVELDHPLVGDVLHARMTARTSRARHAQALALLEEHFASDLDRVAHDLTRHAILGARADRAPRWGVAAMRQALDAGRYRDVVGLAGQLAAPPVELSRAARIDVALLVARAAEETGDTERAAELLSNLLEEDDAGALEAAAALARAQARAGQIAAAGTTLARAAAIAAALAARGEPAEKATRLEVTRLQASLARRTGRFAEAIATLEGILAEGGLGQSFEHLVHDNLAWARYHAGDAKGALEAAKQAVAKGRPGVERAWALRTLVAVGADSLSAAERREHLKLVLGMARDAGAVRLLAAALAQLAELERVTGVRDEAEQCLRQVLQIGPEHADYDDVSTALANLSMLLLQDGRARDAMALLEAAPARQASWEGAIRLVHAAVAVAAGDSGRATDEIEQLRDAAAPLHAAWGVAWAAEYVGRELSSARPDLAAWIFGMAAELWSRLGEENSSARVEALRSAVIGLRDD